MNNDEDYYSTLAVARDASPAEIKKQYRKLALRYHPDRCQSEDAETIHQNAERFKDIANAFQVLSDPEARSRYDAGGSSFGPTFFGQGGNSRFRSAQEVFATFFGQEGEWADEGDEEAQDDSIKLVEPSMVLNLPLFEGFLVIDTRPAAAYESEHLATAHNFPPPVILTTSPAISQLEEEKRLLRFFVRIVEEVGCPDKWDRVVLITDEHCDEHALWVARQLRRYEQGHKVGKSTVAGTTDTAGADANSDAKRQCAWNPETEWWDRVDVCWVNRTSTAKTQIWSIHGGHAAFANSYPELIHRKKDAVGTDGAEFACCTCSSERLSGCNAQMRPTPHHVADGIFLGSRVVEIDKRTLDGFRITHVIEQCASHMSEEERRRKEYHQSHLHEGMSQMAGGEADVPGVTYLRVPVADGDDEQMEGFWRQAIQFIRAAKQARGQTARVLVQLHGRSRSASVVMAWLIAGEKMQVKESAHYLRKKVPQVDWSLIYPEQLMNFQEKQRTLCD